MMPDLDLTTYQKALVIRFSSLGDVLLTTPVIRTLKSQYPALQIDYLVRHEYADAVRHNPNLGKVHELFRDDRDKHLIDDLSKTSYDLTIDLQSNIRSRKITKKLSGKVVRYIKPSVKKFLLVNLKINLLKEIIPIPERYAAALGDLELAENGLELFLPDEFSDVKRESKKTIGLCSGSRHFTKQWPKEYFVELGKLLTGAGFNVVLLGGKDDISLCEEICEQLDGAVNLSNDNDLFRTAVEMKKCSVVICNDSGLMHLATAVDVPTVSIFGSTVKEFGFVPYKGRNLILENNSLSCRPCSHIGRKKCPKKHFKCMTSIAPEYVFEKFNTFYNSL